MMSQIGQDESKKVSRRKPYQEYINRSSLGHTLCPSYKDPVHSSTRVVDFADGQLPYLRKIIKNGTYRRNPEPIFLMVTLNDINISEGLVPRL